MQMWLCPFWKIKIRIRMHIRHCKNIANTYSNQDQDPNIYKQINYFICIKPFHIQNLYSSVLRSVLLRLHLCNFHICNEIFHKASAKELAFLSKFSHISFTTTNLVKFNEFFERSIANFLFSMFYEVLPALKSPF